MILDLSAATNSALSPGLHILFFHLLSAAKETPASRGQCAAGQQRSLAPGLGHSARIIHAADTAHCQALTPGSTYAAYTQLHSHPPVYPMSRPQLAGPETAASSLTSTQLRAAITELQAAWTTGQARTHVDAAAAVIACALQVYDATFALLVPHASSAGHTELIQALRGLLLSIAVQTKAQKSSDSDTSDDAGASAMQLRVIPQQHTALAQTAAWLGVHAPLMMPRPWAAAAHECQADAKELDTSIANLASELASAQTQCVNTADALKRAENELGVTENKRAAAEAALSAIDADFINEERDRLQRAVVARNIALKKQVRELRVKLGSLHMQLGQLQAARGHTAHAAARFTELERRRRGPACGVTPRRQPAMARPLPAASLDAKQALLQGPWRWRPGVKDAMSRGPGMGGILAGSAAGVAAALLGANRITRERAAGPSAWLHRDDDAQQDWWSSDSMPSDEEPTPARGAGRRARPGTSRAAADVTVGLLMKTVSNDTQRLSERDARAGESSHSLQLLQDLRRTFNSAMDELDTATGTYVSPRTQAEHVRRAWLGEVRDILQEWHALRDAAATAQLDLKPDLGLLLLPGQAHSSSPRGRTRLRGAAGNAAAAAAAAANDGTILAGLAGLPIPPAVPNWSCSVGEHPDLPTVMDKHNTQAEDDLMNLLTPHKSRLRDAAAPAASEDDAAAAAQAPPQKQGEGEGSNTTSLANATWSMAGPAVRAALVKHALTFLTDDAVPLEVRELSAPHALSLVLDALHCKLRAEAAELGAHVGSFALSAAGLALDEGGQPAEDAAVAATTAWSGKIAGIKFSVWFKTWLQRAYMLPEASQSVALSVFLALLSAPRRPLGEMALAALTGACDDNQWKYVLLQAAQLRLSYIPASKVGDVDTVCSLLFKDMAASGAAGPGGMYGSDAEWRARVSSALAAQSQRAADATPVSPTSNPAGITAADLDTSSSMNAMTAAGAGVTDGLCSISLDAAWADPRIARYMVSLAAVDRSGLGVTTWAAVRDATARVFSSGESGLPAAAEAMAPATVQMMYAACAAAVRKPDYSALADAWRCMTGSSPPARFAARPQDPDQASASTAAQPSVQQGAFVLACSELFLQLHQLMLAQVREGT